MFSRYRRKHGGSIMIYVNENTPCETVNVEGLSKYNKSGKWICIGLCKPLPQNGKYFLKNVPLALNKMSCV